MLIGLDPLLTPDLLHALASMGHGDEIAIVDANFPAAACARRLVALDAAGAPEILRAVLSVMPLDHAVPHPARVMQVIGEINGAGFTRVALLTDMSGVQRKQ